MTEGPVIKAKFGEPLRPHIVNWAENVRVRLGQDGPQIGIAKVSDEGEIAITLDSTEVALDIYRGILVGMSEGLSIAPYETKAEPTVLKYSDEVKQRLQLQNPFVSEA